MTLDCPETKEIRPADESIFTHYKFGKLIGSGKFGTVKIATNRRDATKIYAVKTIQKSKLQDKLHLL